MASWQGAFPSSWRGAWSICFRKGLVALLSRPVRGGGAWGCQPWEDGEGFRGRERTQISGRKLWGEGSSRFVKPKQFCRKGPSLPPSGALSCPSLAEGWWGPNDPGRMFSHTWCGISAQRTAVVTQTIVFVGFFSPGQGVDGFHQILMEPVTL